MKENKRFYPNAQMAAHVVGFVGLDSRGLEGIEFQYDTSLNGKGEVWKMNPGCLGKRDSDRRAPPFKAGRALSECGPHHRQTDPACGRD